MSKQKERQLDKLLASGKITEEEYELEMQELEIENEREDARIKEARAYKIHYQKSDRKK